jgi:hypothetical protein
MDLSSKTIATYIAVSIASLIVGQFIMGFFGGNKFPVEGKVSFSSTPHETSHDPLLYTTAELTMPLDSPHHRCFRGHGSQRSYPTLSQGRKRRSRLS